MARVPGEFANNTGVTATGGGNGILTQNAAERAIEVEAENRELAKRLAQCERERQSLLALHESNQNNFQEQLQLLRQENKSLREAITTTQPPRTQDPEDCQACNDLRKALLKKINELRELEKEVKILRGQPPDEEESEDGIVRGN